jgi:hypothetical protein
MSIDITTSNGLLLIKAGPGLNYWQLLEAVFKACSMSADADQSQMWLFQEGPVDVKFEDLFQIKDHIQMHYPRSTKRRKFAIVAEGGFVSVIAETFVKIANDLPCEIRFFNAYQEACDWISAPLRPGSFIN